MWARLEPLLPPVKGPMGIPTTPQRPVRLWKAPSLGYGTGVPWRDLPKQFGRWRTV